MSQAHDAPLVFTGPPHRLEARAPFLVSRAVSPPPAVRDQVDGPSGFATGLGLSTDELSRVRDLIEANAAFLRAVKP